MQAATMKKRLERPMTDALTSVRRLTCSWNTPAAMVKITPEAVLSAPQGLNAVNDRELSLRGLKAPAVEALAVARDGFDCVDLSDNEIAKLGGFPPMARLSTLLVANNSIARIATNLPGAARRVEGWTARTQSARLP